MSRRSKDSILESLFELPWWVSVATALVAYVFIRFAIPGLLSETAITAGLGRAAQEHAWMFALFLLAPAPFAALRQYRRATLLDSQSDLTSIRKLSWLELEKIVAEAFHRQGYWVAEKGGATADGGIDLVLKRANERVLVQCKHWRARMVGVAPVRELYGVMIAEHAAKAILVTTGSFSADAYSFASGKPVQLIDGLALEKLVASVRKEAPGSAPVDPVDAALSCPDCGSKMVKRTAKRGARAGVAFWGCSRFPVCRGLRQAA